MRTLAVTSGKGGVGKTNVSVNLAIQLVRKHQQRVLVFDADLGLANVDVVLGVRAEHNLQHVLTGEKRLSQIVTAGPGGISFIAGGSGVDSLVNLSGPQLDFFLTELAQLERTTDFLIFDTGAGMDGSVMTFLQASDEVLLVATPDPASITDAYAIAKALWSKRPGAVIQVVLNMVNDEIHAQAVFAKLRAITEQFLGKTLRYGGFIRHDVRALEFIRMRRPYSLANPNLAASQDITAVAATLMGETFERTAAVSLVDRFKGLFGLRKTA